MATANIKNSWIKSYLKSVRKAGNLNTPFGVGKQFIGYVKDKIKSNNSKDKAIALQSTLNSIMEHKKVNGSQFSYSDLMNVRKIKKDLRH
jgi:hypothetical protein